MNNEILKIKLNKVSPSSNHAIGYKILANKIIAYRKKDLKSFFKYVKKQIKKYFKFNLKNFCLLLDTTGNSKLELKITVGTNFLNKNGTIKRKDLGNFEKYTTDALFEAIKAFNNNIDDKQIWKIKTEKKQSKKDYTIIKLLILKTGQN